MWKRCLLKCKTLIRCQSLLRSLTRNTNLINLSMIILNLLYHYCFYMKPDLLFRERRMSYFIDSSGKFEGYILAHIDIASWPRKNSESTWVRAGINMSRDISLVNSMPLSWLLDVQLFQVLNSTYTYSKSKLYLTLHHMLKDQCIVACKSRISI